MKLWRPIGRISRWLVNMWFGVNKAGYSVKDEAPVALLVFAVPAIVAIVIWWKFSYFLS